jgi:hypothetical protein
MRGPIVSKVLRDKDYDCWKFFCPGCEVTHNFYDSWKFNGDLDRPTVEPSIKVEYCRYPPVDLSTGDFARGADGEYLLDEHGMLRGAKKMVCHSFIRDGLIQFLADCTHELAGKIVPLTDVPNDPPADHDIIRHS